MMVRNIALTLVLSLVVLVPWSSADTVLLKDGTKIEGVIKKVEAGKVFVEMSGELKEFDILKVETMDFNTPHLMASSGIPIEHFMENNEAQEIVKDLAELDKTSDEIRRLISQIQAYWGAKEPIDAKDKVGWDAAKYAFSRPLSRYQELLNDMYFHVLNRVDEYNGLMKDATRVYVGVKGIQIGSSLVPAEMERLPLRKYVPGTWYDTIYYEGYNRGFDDAYMKFGVSKDTYQ